MSPHTTTHRAVAALAVALLLALTGACGAKAEDGNALPSTDDSTSASDGASESPSVDPEDAMLKFAACMREHGVDMPDPGPDGRVIIKGDDPEVMEAAEEACRELREAAMPEDGGGPELSEDEKQAFLDMAQCMRDRGYDFPDPEFESGGGVRQHVGKGEDPGFDPESPAFQSDMAECHAEAGLEAPGFESEKS